MRLGFDVTPLTGPAAGVTRYTLELLRALRENAQEIDLVLLADRRPHDAALARELDALPRLRTPWIPSRAAWMQTALPLALARAHLDICHYTNYAAPMTESHAVCCHAARHVAHHEPRAAPHPARRDAPIGHAPRRPPRASRGLSHGKRATRRDRCAGHRPAARACPAGRSLSVFRRLPDSAATNATLAGYGIRPGYLLFVGTIEPRKNLVRLARAFAALRQEGAEAQLVICGRWGWKSNDLRPAIERLGIADAVVFTGFVPDDDLVALLNGATAFVYPSLYEGFGLPIVEAFACGAPVVTSDRGATAEVAGGAALLVDPTSDESLTDALRRVLSDTAERHRLSAAGLARATDFSRRNAARRAVAIYEAALGT